jgi:nitrate reductase NapE component
MTITFAIIMGGLVVAFVGGIAFAVWVENSSAGPRF